MQKTKQIIANLFAPRELGKRQFIAFAILFGSIIVLANYSVQFSILDTHLTFGALTYPLSFLVSNILCEKYSKPEVLKALRVGLLLAFVPSILAADFRIALASVCAFCISQILDVHVFYYLKFKFPRFWFVRGNGSILSLAIDTIVFFHIAFLFVMPYYDVAMMALSDYAVKVIIVLFDCIFFYFFAIRNAKISQS